MTLKEASLRPPQFMREKEPALQWDRDFLLRSRDQWISVVCPGCEKQNTSCYGEKQGFSFVCCQTCRMLYQSPRPGPQLLATFYRQSRNYAYWNQVIFPQTREVRREKIFRPRVQNVIRLCQKYGMGQPALLEVGAAYGLFCDEARSSGFFGMIQALEPTPDLAQTLRERGYSVLEYGVEDLSLVEAVDVVASFEVIEHVFDPGLFIQKCRQALRQKGILILSCPNVDGFETALLGIRSSTFNHEHLNYFHPPSMQILLEKNGFELLEWETPGELDVDLVYQAFLKDPDILGKNSVWKNWFGRWNAQARDDFQKCLKKNRFSSHLWVVARKKE